MRTARLVGLTPDGKSLIVVTESGEELIIEADERLRAAVRGDRPRLGQLEIEMQTSLTPRDIQARIRAGDSLEDVARIAGLPMDRVERFATPVLAEREHVASMAMSSSVRRRSEPSGHRSLRITVTEWLLGHRVNIDDITWDSYRLDDGRWAITADYRLGPEDRHAIFIYDLRGRFSVAGNDEARWLLGDRPSAKGLHAKGAERGRPWLVESASSEGDSEPTVNLSDRFAGTTAQSPSQDTPSGEVTAADEADEPTVPVSPMLRPVTDFPSSMQPSDDVVDVSPMGTLYEMLGEDGYTEDSARVYAGLSDASAVPETETTTDGGWEPAIVINYPVEPSVHDDTALDVPESVESPRHGSSTTEEELPGTDEPGPPDATVQLDDRADEAHEFEIESLAHPDTPPPKSAKRKRASVPSWDEIMFGGPKRQS